MNNDIFINTHENIITLRNEIYKIDLPYSQTTCLLSIINAIADGVTSMGVEIAELKRGKEE